MSDYCKHLVDKLIIAGLIGGMGIFMLHVMHDPTDVDKDILTWAMRSIDMLFGTLIGLVGGYALARRREEANPVPVSPPTLPKPPETL